MRKGENIFSKTRNKTRMLTLIIFIQYNIGSLSHKNKRIKGQMSSHPDTIWVSFRASGELKPPKIVQKGKKKLSLKE